MVASHYGVTSLYALHQQLDAPPGSHLIGRAPGLTIVSTQLVTSCHSATLVNNMCVATDRHTPLLPCPLLQALAQRVKAASSVTIVGGGPLGVELAGEILTVSNTAEATSSTSRDNRRTQTHRCSSATVPLGWGGRPHLPCSPPLAFDIKLNSSILVGFVVPASMPFYAVLHCVTWCHIWLLLLCVGSARRAGHTGSEQLTPAAIPTSQAGGSSRDMVAQ